MQRRGREEQVDDYGDRVLLPPQGHLPSLRQEQPRKSKLYNLFKAHLRVRFCFAFHADVPWLVLLALTAFGSHDTQPKGFL